MNTYQKSLFWFRRDLRDFDNTALYHALKSSDCVYCLFVFDTDILGRLSDKTDRRVEFIWESVAELKTALQAQGGDLIVKYGSAKTEVVSLAKQLKVEAVFSNRDYEPEALVRDAEAATQLTEHGIAFVQFKDHVLFEQDEILTQQGKPYGVFTPYKNAHLKKLDDFYLKPYPVSSYAAKLHLAKTDANFDSSSSAKQAIADMPTLEAMGFKRSNLRQMKLPTGMSGGKRLFDDFITRMARYQDARNFPAIKGPSYLSVHLRFGTVSIRHLARTARDMGGSGAETWLNELIWRDFYVQILHHHPQVAHGKAYKQEFESLAFPNDEALFAAWCEGRTGYPLIDAAMRQINQTGYMHNRLRMVTASFLVKDLLIDWRWGERYFAQKLIDFDLSANNGGWQWAASTGCDAQPWFRIFNPITQSEKFDGAGKFIRKYIPELVACNDKEIHAPWQMSPERQAALKLRIGQDYPAPVVEHAVQRELTLALYKTGRL